MILEVNHLSKKIKKKNILNDISFNVGDNEIVGFIGPNGAGKSTTLKCICGLYIPTSGSINIAGYDLSKDRQNALSKLGVSIETPALYPDLNGHDHFKIVASWRKLSKERILEMERFSGLSDYSLKQAVGHYSMGMKQRLILSMAMMHQPRLLILDEPTNGLDPQAVFELREKLLEIKQEGASILFSSHQLSEMEKIADRAIFIKDGQMIDAIPMSQIKSKLRYTLKLEPIDSARLVINVMDHVQIIETNEDNVLIEVDEEAGLSLLLEALVINKIKINRIQQSQMDLEDYYKQLYGE